LWRLFEYALLSHAQGVYYPSMQAKNMMDFVSPHDPFTERPNPVPVDTDAITLSYVVSCQRILKKYKDYTLETDRVEDVGIVTVFEVPLRVLAHDGSYLHILVGGSRCDRFGSDDLIDLIVSVIEHEPDGTARSGYMYTINDNVVTRSSVPDDIGETTDEHFSLIGLYDFQDEISAMLESDDLHVAHEAEEVHREVEQAVLLAEASREIGLDDLPVAYEEVEKLGQLLSRAVPFFDGTQE